VRGVKGLDSSETQRLNEAPQAVNLLTARDNDKGVDVVSCGAANVQAG